MIRVVVEMDEQDVRSALAVVFSMLEETRVRSVLRVVVEEVTS